MHQQRRYLRIMEVSNVAAVVVVAVRCLLLLLLLALLLLLLLSAVVVVVADECIDNRVSASSGVPGEAEVAQWQQSLFNCKTVAVQTEEVEIVEQQQQEEEQQQRERRGSDQLDAGEVLVNWLKPFANFMSSPFNCKPMDLRVLPAQAALRMMMEVMFCCCCCCCCYRCCCCCRGRRNGACCRCTYHSTVNQIFDPFQRLYVSSCYRSLAYRVSLIDISLVSR